MVSYQAIRQTKYDLRDSREDAFSNPARLDDRPTIIYFSFADSIKVFFDVSIFFMEIFRKVFRLTTCFKSDIGLLTVRRLFGFDAAIV